MDPPELPEEILRKENQLNQLFDSIEPDVMFARHLESQIIQVARGQQAWQKSSPPQGAWLRSFLISIGKWGLTFAGLGILVMVLVYGIDHLILLCNCQKVTRKDRPSRRARGFPPANRLQAPQLA